MSRIKELGDRFEEIVRRRKSIDTEDKILSGEAEKVEQELLEEMVADGCQNIKRESGMTFYRAEDKFVGVADGVDKEELVARLANDDNFRDIVKTSVDFRTLRTRLNEIEENQEVAVDPAITAMLKLTSKHRVKYRSS
jgi:hypothetical protein